MYFRLQLASGVGSNGYASGLLGIGSLLAWNLVLTVIEFFNTEFTEGWAFYVTICFQCVNVGGWVSSRVECKVEIPSRNMAFVAA